MPVEKESKLSVLLEALRGWLPTVRIRLTEWWQTCRAEPILFWQTPAVRIGVYGIGVLTLMWGVTVAIAALSPGGPEPIPFAETADFHIICSDPACGEHYVIQRKFRFDDFPVKCRACGNETGQRARRCFSQDCRGAWVAPTEVDGDWVCPRCGHHLRHSD